MRFCIRGKIYNIGKLFYTLIILKEGTIYAAYYCKTVAGQSRKSEA